MPRLRARRGDAGRRAGRRPLVGPQGVVPLPRRYCRSPLQLGDCRCRRLSAAQVQHAGKRLGGGKQLGAIRAEHDIESEPGVADLRCRARGRSPSRRAGRTPRTAVWRSAPGGAGRTRRRTCHRGRWRGSGRPPTCPVRGRCRHRRSRRGGRPGHRGRARPAAPATRGAGGRRSPAARARARRRRRGPPRRGSRTARRRGPAGGRGGPSGRSDRPGAALRRRAARRVASRRSCGRSPRRWPPAMHPAR